MSIPAKASMCLALPDSCNKAVHRICLMYLSQSVNANPIRRITLFPPSLRHLYAGHGILTMCPSPPDFSIGLGPTNPWLITIAKETLCFRRAGISPALRLLVPAFSLPYAPAWVTPLPSSQNGTLSYRLHISWRKRRIVSSMICTSPQFRYNA